MFESAVDGLGGSVAGAGPVEERQDVGGALGQGPAEGVNSTSSGDVWLMESIRAVISSRPRRGRGGGRRRSCAGSAGPATTSA